MIYIYNNTAYNIFKLLKNYIYIILTGKKLSQPNENLFYGCISKLLKIIYIIYVIYTVRLH